MVCPKELTMNFLKQMLIVIVCLLLIASATTSFGAGEVDSKTAAAHATRTPRSLEASAPATQPALATATAAPAQVSASGSTLRTHPEKFMDLPLPTQKALATFFLALALSEPITVPIGNRTNVSAAPATSTPSSPQTSALTTQPALAAAPAACAAGSASGPTLITLPMLSEEASLALAMAVKDIAGSASGPIDAGRRASYEIIGLPLDQIPPPLPPRRHRTNASAAPATPIRRRNL